MNTAPTNPPQAGDKPDTAWAAEPERSHLWVLRLMRWIAMNLGRRASRWLLHPISLYFLIANGKARRASRRYLSRALPRRPGWADLYRHIHHFACTVLDRVYFLQDQFHEFDIRITGAERVHALMDQGHGVFLVGAHLGSFEALRASGQTRGARAAMVMYEDNARLINAVLSAIAPQAELHTIPLGRPGSMLALRRWLDEGGLAGMLADRTLPGQSERSGSREIPFLGHAARFSEGPFRLAAMMRRPAIFMTGLYHGGRRYELRFELLADFSAPPPTAGQPQGPVPGARAGATDEQIGTAMHRYVSTLESLCRESPYNWFNFFDFWPADGTPPAAPPTPNP